MKIKVPVEIKYRNFDIKLSENKGFNPDDDNVLATIEIGDWNVVSIAFNSETKKIYLASHSGIDDDNFDTDKDGNIKIKKEY